MNVQRLVIFYNNYDFPNDGVDARSFGGNVELESVLGKMDVRLSRETVQSVLELVSVDVQETVRSMASDVTAADIRRQAQGNMLEHGNG